MSDDTKAQIEDAVEETEAAPAPKKKGAKAAAKKAEEAAPKVVGNGRYKPLAPNLEHVVKV